MHLLVLLLILGASGLAHAEARVMYLANAGLMVTSGDTKILFDPLFRNNFGHYQLLPLEMEEAMFAGAAPFDGVDAIFISHNHEDHFSPADILRYLRAQPAIRLYAPGEAIDALQYFLTDADDALGERIVSVNLNYGDKAIALQGDDIEVEAFHIPHSGWPDRTPEVQNLAFRVTIDKTTVLHLGDADTRDAHFAHDGERWASVHTDAAFPPYWFFTSRQGSAVLEERLKPGLAIGVHVPVQLEAEYAEGLEDHDLFRTPGETRTIPASD